MNSSFIMLILTTFVVGCVHTLIGPDHYIPFVALSKSRNWSIARTITVTVICGLGHILSALILGILALSAGSVLNHLHIIESVRGEIAAWFLTSFGFLYCIWGIRSAAGNKRHIHANREKREMTPWIMFLIFVFGPCEPLIPLILYPAVSASAVQTVTVILIFGISTILVMVLTVAGSLYGLQKIGRFPFMERYGNILAGGAIGSCGLAMTFAGL